jgi:hypothetical protein
MSFDIRSPFQDSHLVEVLISFFEGLEEEE